MNEGLKDHLQRTLGVMETDYENMRAGIGEVFDRYVEDHNARMAAAEVAVAVEEAGQVGEEEGSGIEVGGLSTTEESELGDGRAGEGQTRKDSSDPVRFFLSFH